MTMWLYARKIAETLHHNCHEIFFELTIKGNYPYGGIPFDKNLVGASQDMAALTFFYHPQYYCFADTEQTPVRIGVLNRQTMQELPNNTPLDFKIKGKLTAVAR